MLMANNRDSEARMDELDDDPGQIGPDSGGQSGDTLGLSEIADAADESVEELADPPRPPCRTETTRSSAVSSRREALVDGHCAAMCRCL